MNEAETRAELIDPALKAAGWGVVAKSRVRREVIAPGRLLGAGQREKSKQCDYVLVYRNHKLAALEAKKRDAYPTEGLGQVKDYAERLKTRFALCTNGDKIYQVDMLTGNEEYIDRYPTPDELWAATYPSQNDWRDLRSIAEGIALQPFPLKTRAVHGRLVTTSTMGSSLS